MSKTPIDYSYNLIKKSCEEEKIQKYEQKYRETIRLITKVLNEVNNRNKTDIILSNHNNVLKIMEEYKFCNCFNSLTESNSIAVFFKLIVISFIVKVCNNSNCCLILALIFCVVMNC